MKLKGAIKETTKEILLLFGCIILFVSNLFSGDGEE